MLPAMKTLLSSIRSYKYLEIIFAVALFIVLDAGVLTLNFYTSFQIASDAQAIQVANRQTILSQNIIHELYQLRDDALDEGVNYQLSLERLEETYKAFDETMDAFLYGGELIGAGQGKDALLKDDAYRKANEQTLKKAGEIWQVYRNQVKTVAYAYFNDLTREEVIKEANEAITFARENNAVFYELLNDVAISMRDIAQEKAERLRLIQTIGIGLAVINFFLILFHFLRKLRRSDAEVEKARQETTDILSNVNEGLLLLDKDFKIGSQHSVSLKNIFNQEIFEGRSFMDLLKPMVTEKTMSIVRDYIEILFSDHVSSRLVENLNPLIEVEISLSSQAGDFAVRYLSFEFARVMEEKRLAYLLVTISDVTDKVQIKNALKKAEDKASADMDMLLHVIHLDGNLLQNYLMGMQKSLEEINLLLRKPAKTQPQYVEKLLKIFRIAHTLKGECTAMDLTFMESRLHDFEDLVGALRNNQKLGGSDFIPLTVSLNRLITDVDTLRILVKKLSSNSESSVVENISLAAKSVTGINKAVQDLSVLEGWRSQFEQVVSQVARDHNKAVKLTIEAVEGRVPRMSAELRDIVKNIVIQCLRNAVVHGIEAPSGRSMVGKPLSGSIKVLLEQQVNELLLRIRDDGRGLDINAIRERALKQALYPPEKITNMKPEQLIKLIFLPGFSTYGSVNHAMATSDRHAGRGVGLDVVKALVDSSGAKMGVSYREGEYTEFRFRFNVASGRPLQATA